MTTDKEIIGKLYKQQILHMISTIEEEEEKLVPIILLLFPEKRKTAEEKDISFILDFREKIL